MHFFDRLEDKIRARLSRYPIVYALFGGIGIVLFWRGVWHTTDTLSKVFFTTDPITLFDLVDGPISFFVSVVLLLMTGLFVSSFIGTRIIVSGLKGEKKAYEKTEAEIQEEESQIVKIEKELRKIEGVVEDIDQHHHPKK